MAFIKESTNDKCWKEQEEKGTLLHCRWEFKLVPLLWKTEWRLLKKTKNRTSLVVHLPMEGTRVQYLAGELSQTLQPHPPAPKESDDEWHLSKGKRRQSTKRQNANLDIPSNTELKVKYKHIVRNSRQTKILIVCHTDWEFVR